MCLGLSVCRCLGPRLGHLRAWPFANPAGCSPWPSALYSGVGHTAGEPWGRAPRAKDLRWAREGAFKAESYIWADNDWFRWWGSALRPRFGPHPGLVLFSLSAFPMPVYREAGHRAGDARGARFCLQTSPLDERYALRPGHCRLPPTSQKLMCVFR